jgi:thiol-disulfide isomerase/thioredoxin
MGMTTRGRRAALIALVGVAALGAGVYFGYQRFQPDAPPPQAAAALAGLALPDPSGKEQRLDQWRGKVLVVNFWATWCAPCREEMPEFMKAQQEFGPKGLQFVGIAVDQADKVEQYVKEISLNYPALIGGFGAMELSKTLGNSLAALPFTVVVDRQGAIAHTQLGILKPDKLDSLIKKLL